MKKFNLKSTLLLSLSTVLLGACVTQTASPPTAPSPTLTASPIASPGPVASASPSQATSSLEQIEYGLSYGFCRGYCDHRLSITAERMRLVHKAFGEPEKYPEQVIEKPTPVQTWQKLNRQASFQTLQSLPERVGCPDCADGGAEWIALQQAKSSKRVTFEPQAGLPQQAELLAELRKMYQELNAEVSVTDKPSS